MMYSKWKYFENLRELRLYKIDGQYWGIKMDNSELAISFLKFLKSWMNDQLEF